MFPDYTKITERKSFALGSNIDKKIIATYVRNAKEPYQSCLANYDIQVDGQTIKRNELSETWENTFELSNSSGKFHFEVLLSKNPISTDKYFDPIDEELYFQHSVLGDDFNKVTGYFNERGADRLGEYVRITFDIDCSK